MFVQKQAALRKTLSGSAIAQVAEALRAAEQCNLSPMAAQMVAEALATLQAPAAVADKAPADNTARNAFNGPFWAAVDAVRAAHGEMWHQTPGARVNVKVPAEVVRYVNKQGKVERGERVKSLPAAHYWPGGTFPAGFVAMGDASGNGAFRAEG